MNPKRTALALILASILLFLPSTRPAAAQDRPPVLENPVLKTPLPAKTLSLLANEISGQVIFNNEVKLAGAPWQREESEFADTFYETRTIHALVRGYGIETTRIERFPGAVDAAGETVAISAYNQGTQRRNLFNQTDLVWHARSGAIQHTLMGGVELGRRRRAGRQG